MIRTERLKSMLAAWKGVSPDRCFAMNVGVISTLASELLEARKPTWTAPAPHLRRPTMPELDQPALASAGRAIMTGGGTYEDMAELAISTYLKDAQPTTKPVAWGIEQQFTDPRHRKEFERNGLVVFHAPIGTAGMPLYAALPVSPADWVTVDGFRFEPAAPTQPVRVTDGMVEAEIASILHHVNLIGPRNYADQRLYLLRGVDRLRAALAASAKPATEAQVEAAARKLAERNDLSEWEEFIPDARAALEAALSLEGE